MKRAEHPSGLPSLAVEYCLEYAGLKPWDLSAVAACTFSQVEPTDDVRLNSLLRPDANDISVFVVPHHLGHAAGVFGTSGFEESAVLVIDGHGSEWGLLDSLEFQSVCEPQRRRYERGDRSVYETISLYSARRTQLVPLEKQVALFAVENKPGMPRFCSLGKLFADVGFQVFGDRKDAAGKLMGLAAYGRPNIPVSEFFRFDGSEFTFYDNVPDRFLHSDRWPLRGDEYADLAASAQEALTHGVMEVVRRLRALCSAPRLCYAGGAALNCPANERLIRESGFEDVFVMPAAEDSGTAIGAAYCALWRLSERFEPRRLTHDAVGRSYTRVDITQSTTSTPGVRAVWPSSVIDEAVELLCEGKILGWFQGGSELGPRALGQRSILCDPRRTEMKEILNRRIKFREEFRPYAPIVPIERATDWFDVPPELAESPYMLRTMLFRSEKRASVPAVVHVDGTGRVQTLTPFHNGKLYELACRFGRRTGVPVLLNTSLNVAGEPIAETPADAIWYLISSGLDACILDDCVVTKQTDFNSVLDFYPLLLDVWLSEHYPVVAGGLGRAAGRAGQSRFFYSLPEGRILELEELASRYVHEHLRIGASTRWGRVTHVTNLEALPLLLLMDGSHTGWQVLKAAHGTCFGSEPELSRFLGKLFQGSSLRFLADPAHRVSEPASTAAASTVGRAPADSILAADLGKVRQ